MDLTIILLINGFFLSFVLLVLLIMFSVYTPTNKPSKENVKKDIDKIKEQVEKDD